MTPEQQHGAADFILRHRQDLFDMLMNDGEVADTYQCPEAIGNGVRLP